VPKPALRRLASGYFLDPECGLYEPDCTTSTLSPLIGQDVRTADLSWTGAAGGIVANPRDLTKWVRALFGGRVLPPKQLAEMMEMVSLRTGKPITDVSAADPQGFALGLGRLYHESIGSFWFYEGETLGYRAIFGWFADKDLVISIATNSHPKSSEDHIGALVESLYGICTAA
jgi:D-alanyl-D-alanine carboxypeptidase